MKLIFALLLAIIFCIGTASAELLYRYDFTDIQNSVIKDLSGNNLDGQLKGNAKSVVDEGHNALEIGDKTGFVVLGNNPKLKIKGDLTITAWVKNSNTSNDDQLIIGDNASLGTHRNFLLFNSKGNLRFDHGNGGAGVNDICTSNTSPFDGKWHHVAFIAEYPYYYFYIDGKLDTRGKMGYNIITPQNSADIQIGGWWAGSFSGSIGDLRVYNNVLNSKEIAEIAGVQPAASVTMELSTKISRAKSQIIANAHLSNFYIVGNNAKPKVVLSLNIPGQEIISKTVEINVPRPGSDRCIASATFDNVKFKSGKCSITATLINTENKNIESADYEWNSVGTPSWLTSKMPTLDKVPAPFTPVKMNTAKQNGKLTKIDVSVWGRTYTFTNSLFPSQIITLNKKIIPETTQISVIAGNNGQSFNFNQSEMKIIKSTPTEAIIQCTSTQNGITISAKHTIQFDGFMKSVWTVDTKDAKSIDALYFEMPMKSSFAKYVYVCGAYEAFTASLKTGLLKEGTYERGMNPLTWFGDEDCGIQWICENQKNWNIKSPANAIKITKDANLTTYRVNIIDQTTSLTPGEKLAYEFALQASPTKPMLKDGWDFKWASCSIIDYGKDYDLLTRQVDGMPILDYYKKQGVGTILVMNWTKTLAYTYPTGHEKDLKNLVVECHKRGIKLIPYFGFQISELTPEFPEFGEDVMNLPVIRGSDKYPGEVPQMVDSVCLRSVWKKFLVNTIAKLIDDYDVDGIYLDTTVMPFACTNENHGCGYIDKNGIKQSEFPIFDVRETLMGLYKVVKSRKFDGVIDAHVWDGMTLPALSFSTSYWNGEQLAFASGDNYLEVLPLDRFRVDFTGRQWGTPADFLHYKLGDFKKAFAITLIHDVLVRNHAVGKEAFDTTAKIWKIGETFGRKQAKYLPYWSNADYVSTGSKEVYASLYKHPKNGVMMIVSNLGKTSDSAQIKLNLEKLGIKGLKAYDAMEDKPIAIDSGTIKLNMSYMDWKIIIIN